MVRIDTKIRQLVLKRAVNVDHPRKPELRTLDLGLDMGVKREKSRRWVKSSAGTMAAFSIMDLEIRKVRRGEGS